jgi:transposase, IS5 family
MAQDYLHGRGPPRINAMLAATGWNLKKMMEKLRQGLLHTYHILVLLLKYKRDGLGKQRAMG